MADHYYTQNPTSAHDERMIKAEVLGNLLTFVTDAGVFSRDGVDSGTRLLVEALPELTGRVLDLGCGWGAVGVSLGRKYPEIELVMTDINERAAELSRKNLRANGVKNAVVVTGDAFESVEGKFSAVITNPPIRAGKQVIYGMFETAKEYLEDGGCLYIVIRKQQGAPSAIKFLSGIYADVEVIDRGGGFWVIRARKGGENA